MVFASARTDPSSLLTQAKSELLGSLNVIWFLSAIANHLNLRQNLIHVSFFVGQKSSMS